MGQATAVLRTSLWPILYASRPVRRMKLDMLMCPSSRVLVGATSFAWLLNLKMDGLSKEMKPLRSPLAQLPFLAATLENTSTSRPMEGLLDPAVAISWPIALRCRTHSFVARMRVHCSLLFILMLFPVVEEARQHGPCPAATWAVRQTQTQAQVVLRRRERMERLHTKDGENISCGSRVAKLIVKVALPTLLPMTLLPMTLIPSIVILPATAERRQRARV
mmetsp:Transcript_45830/g.68188  ORF Transcript_45830/g.68188 Transcript_45830/m.68188 type:complete len:220 (-) Transcript_45830:88-747(-)